MICNISTLARVPARVIGAAFVPLYEELASFSPSTITMAPDRIAQLKGYDNFQKLSDCHRKIRRLDAQMFVTPLLNKGDLTKLDQSRFLTPSNYLRKPIEYLPIEITIRLLLGEKPDIKSLQLASNYGPYLVYLREMRGFTKLGGIDIDHSAVQYAREIGNPVLAGSATDLPFADSSLDLVFSHHFLTRDYREVERMFPLNIVDFIGTVAGEIYRVLKPGGIFISQDEDIHLTPNLPFNYPQGFSPETIANFRSLETIKVFQKD